jgi:hypothetical protein
MLDQFDPQEKLDTQMQPKEEKDRKEGRSLFRWLIYGLLGLGGISLVS